MKTINRSRKGKKNRYGKKQQYKKTARRKMNSLNHRLGIAIENAAMWKDQYNRAIETLHTEAAEWGTRWRKEHLTMSRFRDILLKREMPGFFRRLYFLFTGKLPTEKTE